jgi:type IV pilus assembly protein PilA
VAFCRKENYALALASEGSTAHSLRGVEMNPGISARPPQNGFTLIELLIVMTIIGILATVALPLYQEYSAKAKVSEVLLAASACKITITEVSQVGLASLPNADGFGCAESSSAKSRYVSALHTNASGIITVTVQNIGAGGFDGETIVLTPYSDGAATVAMAAQGYQSGSQTPIATWKCSGSLAARYMPSSCR